MVSSQWQDRAAWSSSALIAGAAEGAKQVSLHSVAVVRQPASIIAFGVSQGGVTNQSFPWQSTHCTP